MANQSLAFVRFMRLLEALKSESKHRGVLHHDADLLLGFLYEESEAGRAVIMTSLVHQLRFGTPPTIQRRVKELIASGFVEIAGGDDKRHRCLKVTAVGDAYLKECSRLMSLAASNGATG